MTRHVDRYSIKWDPDKDELTERITRDEDIHCTRWADGTPNGTPMLPWSNGYGYITDWHEDDECAAHKPRYTRHDAPDDGEFRLATADEVARHG